MMDCAGVFCDVFFASVVVYGAKIFRWIKEYVLKFSWLRRWMKTFIF